MIRTFKRCAIWVDDPGRAIWFSLSIFISGLVLSWLNNWQSGAFFVGGALVGAMLLWDLAKYLVKDEPVEEEKEEETWDYSDE